MTDYLSPLEKHLADPLTIWNDLRDRIQQQNIKRFSEVADDFLRALWALDQYRIAGIAPPGMGKAGADNNTRMSGAYRAKGLWFGDILSLLLVNQTTKPLAPRSNVQGFSQVHQIDIAWPVQKEPIEDPLVCVETKVMGAPAFGSTPARGATSDWSNRRKELKFQATDLKLYRRRHETRIDHWDNWRRAAPPAVYFIWCARLGPKDNFTGMLAELRELTDTYLDGAAVIAFRENASGNGYEPMPMTQRDRRLTVDDVLHRIANQINDLSTDPS